MEKQIKQCLDRKAKDKAYNNYMHVSILKSNPGKLFKGHVANITYGEDADNQYLSFMNKYYDAIVFNKYDFTTGVSRIIVSVTTPITKYFERFVNTITDNGKLELTFKEVNDIQTNYNRLDIYGEFIELQYCVFIDRFTALNHEDNINLCNEARRRIKMFKSIIRESGDDLDFCKNVTYVDNDKVYLSESLYA
jgi:hypothetical protein